MRIGNCIVPDEFHVLDLGSGLKMTLILRRDFMSTTGVIADMVKNKISFTHTDKIVYYEAVSENRSSNLASWIGIFDIVSVYVPA